jgi:hypothetical protein
VWLGWIHTGSLSGLIWAIDFESNGEQRWGEGHHRRGWFSGEGAHWRLSSADSWWSPGMQEWTTGCGTWRGSRECGRGGLQGPAEEVRGGWTCSDVGALRVATACSFCYSFEPRKSINGCADEREGEGRRRGGAGYLHCAGIGVI